MISARKLTYCFLSLPHIARMRIVQDLELLQEGDEKLEDMELFRKAFRRAREENKLKELWDLIEVEYNDGVHLENPSEKRFLI